MSKDKLGFRYGHEVSDLVDADEYREFLNNPKLTDEERAYLKQFLMEYYGNPSKKKLKVHDESHFKKLGQDLRDRRREIKPYIQPDFTPTSDQYHKKDVYYSPDDYRSRTSATPEDALIALEEWEDSQDSDD